MKQLLDFIPLIIFFAVYKLHDIYAATGALMAATLLQMIVVWFLYKKLERSHLITLVLVLGYSEAQQVLLLDLVLVLPLVVG